MIAEILKNRTWKQKFSIKNRNCYISGKSLWMKTSYRGRKTIRGLLSSNKDINDDIWISVDQYNNLSTEYSKLKVFLI